jgi:hypothetical protein
VGAYNGLDWRERGEDGEDVGNSCLKSVASDSNCLYLTSKYNGTKSPESRISLQDVPGTLLAVRIFFDPKQFLET